jgi:hypothetical protein
MGYDEKVTLYLLVEVLDTQTNELRTITLAVMADGQNLNGKSYKAENVFDVSYDEINEFLKAMNPKLEVHPGKTSLAVAALWDNGHQAGGFGRGGVFRLPADAGVRATGSVGSANAARAARADLPLDLQVAYPPATFIPGYGPPLPYLPANQTAAQQTLSAGKLGGNPDITPFLKGQPRPPSAEEMGWKDTARMNPGEVTRILVRFAPQDVPVGEVSAGRNEYPFDPTEGPGSRIRRPHNPGLDASAGLVALRDSASPT